MTQLHQMKPKNWQQNRISEWHFSEKKNNYNRLNGKLGIIGE